MTEDGDPETPEEVLGDIELCAFLRLGIQEPSPADAERDAARIAEMVRSLEDRAERARIRALGDDLEREAMLAEWLGEAFEELAEDLGEQWGPSSGPVP